MVNELTYQTPTRPPWRRALRRAFKWGHTMRWRALPPDYTRTYHVKANGFDIIVLPSVFHPTWHFTSLFLAEACEQLVQPNARVLEIGTGTGLVALSAARHASRVVAVDINPLAVECARLNVRNNGMDRKVEVYEGDMFAPVAGERFDVILCNPPYFRGAPRSNVEAAYMGGSNLEWISRLATEAHDHLNEHGSLYCVFGDAADVSSLVALIEQQGWTGQIAAKRDLLTEELTIWRFRVSDPRLPIPDPQPS